MEFTFKSKFNLEEVVWFMYENEPVQGLIKRISYIREESVNTAWLHKKIFHKIISLLCHKRVNVTLTYELDMVESDGTFISCPYCMRENEIFKTKEELLKSL